jgi:hypothetical protein
VGKGDRLVNPTARFYLPEAAAVRRPPGEATITMSDQEANLQLRTWGIRRNENILNSKSLARIVVRFTSK